MASMGFARLIPMWVWLVLAALASSASHLVCVFSHILWEQTVNHSPFFSPLGVGFTSGIFYRIDAGDVI